MSTLPMLVFRRIPIAACLLMLACGGEDDALLLDGGAMQRDDSGTSAPPKDAGANSIDASSVDGGALDAGGAMAQVELSAEGGQATLDESGLVIVADDGSYRLTIPRDSVLSDVEITLERIELAETGLSESAADSLLTPLYRLGPEGQTFEQDLELRFRIEGEAHNPVVAFVDGSRIEALENLGFDPSTRMAYGTTRHFSVFGGFGLPHCIGPEETLPVDFDPSDFDPSDFDPSDHDPSDFDPSDFDPSDHDPSDFDPSDHDPSDFDPSDHDPSDFDPSDFDPSDFDPSDFDPSDYPVGSGWFEGLCSFFTFD